MFTATDKDIGEMIKNGNDFVVIWTCLLSNMAFENVVVPGDWRNAVIVLFKNYRGIGLLSVGKQIYSGAIADTMHRMSEGLIDDVQRGFQTREKMSGSSFHFFTIWWKSIIKGRVYEALWT